MRHFYAIGILGIFCACAKSGPTLQSAPDVDINLLQADKSGPAKLSSLRGQPVILEFWSTWCEPCVEQIPHLAAVAKKYEGRPLRIISISDESRETIQGFLKTHPMPGWIAYDGREAFRVFGVNGRPKTILIDAKGRIAGSTYPSELNEQVLDNLLAGKALSLQSDSMEADEPAAGNDLLSLRIALSSGTAGRAKLSFGNDSYQARNLPLEAILPQVYDVPDDRLLLDASNWKGRFDCEAKVPRAAANSMHELMRRCFETALGLRSRRENRNMDVLLLRKAGKERPGLKPSTRKHESLSSYGHTGVTVAGVTMTGLAGYLELALERPVIDETGLAGRFDVDLKWEAGAKDVARREILDQLGLKLETGRRSLQVVVVESDLPRK